MIIKHSTGSIDSVYDKNKKEWVKKEPKPEDNDNKDVKKSEKTEKKSEKQES